MKTSMLTHLNRLVRSAALLAAGLLVTSGIVRADTRWATLEAIHQIENPRNLTRPGKHGELGAYQFRPTTWREYTKVPFSQALNREASDRVAVEHYEWLKRGLEQARIPATTYNIALAWNGGLEAAVLGRSPRAAHDYATRVATIANVIAKTAAENQAQARGVADDQRTMVAAQ